MSNEKERTHSRQTHHHGPMGGHGMGHVEKAKDFKGSIGKLTAYMGRYKIAIFIVMIFRKLDGVRRCRTKDFGQSDDGALRGTDGQNTRYGRY